MEEEHRRVRELRIGRIESKAVIGLKTNKQTKNPKPKKQGWKNEPSLTSQSK